MKILAVAGLKGGVGKTTTAVNLAWIASRTGARTLLIDLDPQGAASWLLRVEPRLHGGARHLVRGWTDAAAAIRATDYHNLCLLPADLSFRNLDRRLDEAPGRRKRLGKLLEPLATEFDLVIIDVPPGLGLLVENVLRASRCVLLPTLPAQLSLNASAQVQRFVEERLPGGPAPVCFPFFSFVDRRRGAHRRMVEGERPLPGMLDTVIPYSADFERMIERRAPLPVTAPRSRATSASLDLWSEVADRLDGPSPSAEGV